MRVNPAFGEGYWVQRQQCWGSLGEYSYSSDYNNGSFFGGTDGGGGDEFSSTEGTSESNSDDGKGTEQECAGNPIMIQSGNKIQYETDYVGNGEFPLSIERTYNKAWGSEGLFGEKWITNYGYKLTFVHGAVYNICQQEDPLVPIYTCESNGTGSGADGITEIIALRPDGTKYQFQYQSFDNSWVDYKSESVQKIKQVGAEWVYTTEDEFVERYDLSGKLIQRTSPSGIYHKYTYNNELLASVSHSSGRSLTFSYTAGKLTQITDSAGNHYDYTYNSDGYLDSVTRPGTPATSKHYYYEDSRFPGALTKIRDGNNDFAYFTYHADGRGASTSHRGNNETFSFSYGNNTTTVTNPLGHASTYRYKTVNGREVLDKIDRAEGTYCPASSSNVTYDSNGFIDKQTDWKGNVTDFDYNAKGQLTKKTIASGTSSATVFTYLWKAGENKIAEQSSADSKVNYTYNSQGRLASMKITDLSSYGNYGETRTTTFSYIVNGKGIVTKQTVDGPRTDVSDITVYDFDSHGNLIKLTNALGHETLFSQYDALGNVGRIVDPNGLQTDLTYDAAGHIMSKTIYNSTGTQKTQYQYNSYGKLSKITYPNNKYTSMIYDLAHRLSKLTNSEGGVITYGYNVNSQVISTVISEQLTTTTIPPGCWGGGALSSRLQQEKYNTLKAFVQIVNPCDPVTTTTTTDYYSKYSEYDSMGRLHQAVGNNSQKTIFDYDNNSNIESITDASGHVTTMTYNELNQLTSSTASDGGVTGYGYDSAGRVRRVIDARNLSTQYQYNGFGDLVKLISPDTGTTTYTYNQSGQVLSQQRNDGSLTTYTYDALGRVRSESTSDGNKSFVYDSNGSSTYGIGRLFFVTDGSGKTVYAYDKVGNVIQKSSEVDGKTYVTHYAFNTMNQMTQMTYPSGHKLNYSYDAAGNVSKVSYQNGTTISNVAYNLQYLPYGPLKSLTYGNGALRTITHDLDYRPTRIYTSAIQDMSFQYDSKNNITKITNAQNTNTTQTLKYDVENRLTQSVATGAINVYTYDKVGNRKTNSENFSTENYNYASNSNRLTSITNGVGNISYNANGQTTSKGGATLSYNQDNRLVSQTKSGKRTTFSHNAFGQRVTKSGQYGSFHYIYNEAGQLIAEHSSAGTVQNEYVYLNGQVVGLIKSNVLYYVHNDHLGRAERITNASKATVWRANNYAFDRVVTTNTIGDFNLGFPGQYFDKETGFYYNYFRDYDPEMGRYIESDPIGLNGGINTYDYVGGRPINMVDPYGLISIKFDIYLGIGGGITFGYNPDTGHFFGGGRLGLGVGGGANLDAMDNGPEALPRKTNPYGKDCSSLKAGDHGTRAGGFFTLGAGLGPYGVAYGGQGGKFFDGTGNSYSQAPGFGASFTGIGGDAGLSFGGAAGFEVIGWGG